ncbi:MAG: hypothetical protein Q8R20_02640 [Nanoarchaeota archaeon]|nr:hypothetical protein [Nanoarchaeota archaeon]
MEKEIFYSPHLEFRLKLRKIPRVLPEKIFASSSEHYFDRETGLFIAIGRSVYRKKRRDVAVVYKEAGNDILLVTIHPLKPGQKENRVQAGRWQKI